MTAKLIIPSIDYQASFLNALDEYHQENLPGYEKYSRSQLEKDFWGFLDQLRGESYGLNLPPGYVPHTEYWLIDNDEYIGRVDIRHQLNDHLEKIGGHIGYNIRPTKRRQGYGRLVLKLALTKAKHLGLNRVLVVF
jgi:predicted acetyltransferase